MAKKKKLPKYERRLFAAWRVLFPCGPVSSKGVPWGAKAGFGQRLEAKGVVISTNGVSRWLAGKHPMPDRAVFVLEGIEADARHSLLQQRLTLG